jgi:hypothetical protein
MTQVIEGVLTIVKGLNRKARRQFLQRLLESGLLTEDEQDRLVIESRRRDPRRPLENFVANMKRKGRLG